MVYEAHRHIAAHRHQHYAEVRLEILEIEFVLGGRVNRQDL